MKAIKILIFLGIFLNYGCIQQKDNPADKLNISGIYPELAMYNEEGECGTGAVVPFADRLWVITYGPHLPYGSSDKLYEIDSNFNRLIRTESTGGTPANRMIHPETGQLFIGPYVIDKERNVRVIPYNESPGRFTGNARHLTDPENKMYVATMEEGFYEIDMHNLSSNILYTDGNVLYSENKICYSQNNPLLPGCHGKGLYSGQGVLVYSNNGESSDEALSQFNIQAGVLAEWDGNDWKVVRRNQFTEVTGPGGIYGNSNPATDPIWAVGFDHKSLLLGVRTPDNGWNFYRFPKGSNSYDGAHGWNTEWPRIRNIGTDIKPDYLMTMHGMFWSFPKTFQPTSSQGIRPISNYLKVIGDFTSWNGQLVFGCDDSAQKEFLNTRTIKGKIEGPGQSNSNLWFTSTEQIKNLGPVYAGGSVYLNEEIKADTYSEPFLFAGWENRSVWLKNQSSQTVTITLELDANGINNWNPYQQVMLQPEESKVLSIPTETKGEWIRFHNDIASILSITMSYAPVDKRNTKPDKMFNGITSINDNESEISLLYGLGNNKHKLGILKGIRNGMQINGSDYYEVDSILHFNAIADNETTGFMKEHMTIPDVLDQTKNSRIEVLEGSVLIIDERSRRWKLPLGNSGYTDLLANRLTRVCREVATERDLFNCHGTFYELPAENADGFAKIKPISSHDFAIYDYASYRGLMILSGLNGKAEENKHIFKAGDNEVSIWAGTIDDLWKMGKPTGKGGPWINDPVTALKPSDPYLIGNYDKRNLTLSHTSDTTVSFTIQFDPTGDGVWYDYKEITVYPNENYEEILPANVQGRWIRFIADKNCMAKAWLEYS